MEYMIDCLDAARTVLLQADYDDPSDEAIAALAAAFYQRGS
jgi:hypothetical protein